MAIGWPRSQTRRMCPPVGWQGIGRERKEGENSLGDACNGSDRGIVFIHKYTGIGLNQEKIDICSDGIQRMPGH